ncbi:piggyBac transposable element-derived protein 4-like isoform X1 [Anthonomus grandis grandis]|uniref:piggyBac transposable element-derived protein 4-like isoform X1 n=1 Tax=Anthonomus grandis grandis TaxID=2921223 RepID=UPI002166AC4A|nr:piggyBac transposable element-derived protein 4-like isoform X1 [Anthonomus grandis grandis]
MALNPKTELSDYFSNNWIDHQPFFKDIFSRDRFMQIFWNLHVSPPEEEQMGVKSRSAKVKNVLWYLETQFKKFYTSDKNISVDESTIGFKGKVSFKVYNKAKPTKWGIKVYVLADSKNGYIFTMEPYLGIQTTQGLIRPDLPATARIVVHLVQKLLNSGTGSGGYHIFIDRYYSSPLLARELHKINIHVAGTVMANRQGIPTELTTAYTRKFKKGEISSRHDNSISVLAWKDKRVVLMLSSVYDNSVQNITRRTKTAEGRWIEEVIEKPTVIYEYNKFMGEVDVADHYAASYQFLRKTSKWWRKVFFWLLDVSINNAFILQKIATNNQQLRSRNFRKKLVIQLVGNYRNTSRRRSAYGAEDISRLNNRFHAIYARKNNSDCKVCSDQSKKGGRKTTTYYCKTCQDHPALHPGECFDKYHTEENYR